MSQKVITLSLSRFLLTFYWEIDRNLKEPFKMFQKGIAIVDHVPSTRRILSLKYDIISLLSIVVRKKDNFRSDLERK